MGASLAASAVVLSYDRSGSAATADSNGHHHCDIQQEFYPEFFTQEELSHRALMYLPSCQEATAVVTLSRQRDRASSTNTVCPRRRFTVSIRPEFRDDRGFALGLSPEQVLRKYHLPSSYAFYPANMWPHKNHRLLLLALHRLRQRYGVRLPLVLTGDDLGQWKTLHEIAQHFQLHEQLYYLGYVAAEELTPLYAGATMVVFPSLYEGFGLPLLEAMQVGCPVAAANPQAFPRSSEAALLFDPRSPDCIAEAMHRLVPMTPCVKRSVPTVGNRRPCFPGRRRRGKPSRCSAGPMLTIKPLIRRFLPVGLGLTECISMDGRRAESPRPPFLRRGASH